MYPSSSVSYDIAQARIADLHHQARREGTARAAVRRVPGRFRSVLRHRDAAAVS